jgi:cobalt-zinc-cadmium efflux system outer membrane protein
MKWSLLFLFLVGSLPLLASTDTDPPSGDPITLSTALALALENNPTLKAHALGPRVAEARVLQAGFRPNPELAVEVENFLGTGRYSGIDSLETTLQLSQLVDLGGTIDRRVESASAQREVALAAYESQRVDVFAEVARRYVEIVAEQELLANARAARELGEQALAAIEARAEAAQASRLEINQAKAVLEQLRIEEEHAEHELASCRQSLAAALGDTTPHFGVAQADLLKLPEVPDFEVLAARLESSPTLARLGAEDRWQQARLHLARSLARSPAVFSAGLRRTEVSDDFGFVAGFSMPLPVRDPSTGAVREAEVQRELTAAEVEVARLELRATLFEVYQEMVHAHTAITSLQQVLLPTAEESLALVREGYEHGRYSLLELRVAQQALVAHRTELVHQATAYQLHVIEIERLLGGPLSADSQL